MVSVDLAGVIGPCPSCAKTIRAPFNNYVEQPDIPDQVVTTSQTVIPAEPEPYGVDADELVKPESFSATYSIDRPRREDLDDSWRAKHDKDRELAKKRQKRDRMIWNLCYSKGAKKFQRFGAVVLTGILVATAAVLYLNRRSGGALLERVFGS